MINIESFPYIRLKKGREPVVSEDRKKPKAREATRLDVARVLFEYSGPYMKAIRQTESHPVIYFAKEVAKRSGYPEIDGVEELQDKIRDINPHDGIKILLVGNHIDMLGAGAECSLWNVIPIAAAGEAAGVNPRIVISRKFTRYFPESTGVISVSGRSNINNGSHNGKSESVKSLENVLYNKETQVIVLFPDNKNRVDDIMGEAHSGGLMSLIETATLSDIELIVVPLAFNQKTVYRRESVGNDKLSVRTGEPIDAREILPTGYFNRRDTFEERKNKRRLVTHGDIMPKIAMMLPPEKRGDYADAVRAMYH